MRRALTGASVRPCAARPAISNGLAAENDRVGGWSLVCPVNHAVNLVGDYARGEFWRFASAAARIVEGRYGACSFFEHGAGTEESLTGCGAGHAHGHLAPLNLSLEAEAHRRRLHCRAMKQSCWEWMHSIDAVRAPSAPHCRCPASMEHIRWTPMAMLDACFTWLRFTIVASKQLRLEYSYPCSKSNRTAWDALAREAGLELTTSSLERLRSTN